MSTVTKSQDVPDFLRFLDQTLNLSLRRLRKQELGYDIYYIDFSSWKLRLSSQTPVICVRAEDVAALPPQQLAQSLADVVRIQNLAESNPIALVAKPVDRLRDYLKLSYLPVIVLDEEDQRAVLTSRRPNAELLDRVCAHLSLAALSPYETSKPVTGSRFFGRDYEINRILSEADSNVAVMGIRRVGKTSLLREIQYRLLQQAHEHGDINASERIVYMDCSAVRTPEHFMQEVVRQLNPPELNRLEHRRFPLFLPDFLKRMSKQYKGQLVFLLDEIDALLESEFSSVELLDKLRSASNAGYSRFIIAGFRKLFEASSNLNSPLFNFARPLRLKEFSRDDTVRLILQPMENMRIRVERPNEVVERIYGETAGQPNLIQFYCNVLIERLDREDNRTVSPENLLQIYENEDFRAYMLNTFIDNTNNLEKAIVFAVILDLVDEQRFDLEAIDRALERHEIQATLADLERSCRNLELAGTFSRQERSFYFSAPLFPQILRNSYNVDYLFRKIMQEGIW
jgi:AAA+ ATPase superfamily predicted ATPase